ncbi:MAG: MmgE/PrpD family protein [Propionibacteriaceae bacterium]|jgi:2-methylcitrate dehydratase PrpD|nr:MmgE/PrpD family protein [Propionibacteriaceae bacterium]
MPEPAAAGPAAAALGRAAAATSFAAAPVALRQRAVDVFIDCLAVMAVGSERGPQTRLRALLGGDRGSASLIGQSEPVAAAVAVVGNGTYPTVYQIDEGQRMSRGHPGIHVVPVVLALSEEGGRSADDFFSALMAGYEVAARVGQSLGGTKAEIHPHGNWGTIGAAAASAWLLGRRDPQVIATAIDLAASLALGPDRASLKAGQGAHHLMAALGAEVGLVAGAAAAAGFSATPGCLERFFGPRSGVAFDPGLLLEGVGPDGWSEFKLASSYFKLWPACAHTHTSINAALALRQEFGFAPEAVERIEIRAFGPAASLDRSAVGDNDLAARYSVPYVVAAALLDGRFDLDSFTPERLAAPGLRRLIDRVQLRHDPALDAGYPERGRPIVMEIVLNDGRRLIRSAALSEGDSELPASPERLRDKAATLLAHRFGPAAAERVLAAAQAFARGAPIQDLSGALRAAARPEPEPAPAVARPD